MTTALRGGGSTRVARGVPPAGRERRRVCRPERSGDEGLRSATATALRQGLSRGHAPSGSGSVAVADATVEIAYPVDELPAALVKGTCRAHRGNVAADGTTTISLRFAGTVAATSA